MGVSEFIQRHITEAEAALESFERRSNPVQCLAAEGDIYAFCVDLGESFPICFRVIEEFCKNFGNMDGQLVLYISNTLFDKQKIFVKLMEFLEHFQNIDCCIQIIDEADITIRDIIRNVDAYITNRSKENLYAVNLAQYYNKRVVSGVDCPVF